MKSTVNIFLTVCMAWSSVLFAQFDPNDPPYYTAAYVSPESAPVLGEGMDDIWQKADLYEMLNSHATDPSSPDDFSATFAIMYNESYLYFLWDVNDDTILVEESVGYDYTWEDGPKWWWDDAVTIMCGQDLFWWPIIEFAWAPMNGHEMKARFADTGKDENGGNASKPVDPSYSDMVFTPKIEDADTIGYYAEARISWGAFTYEDGDLKAGDEFQMDVRARDDDNGEKHDHLLAFAGPKPNKNFTDMGWVILDENTGTGVQSALQPNEFHLKQNYPNPFNPVTTISYSISASDNVTLTVHNLKGECVETLVREYQTPGEYSVSFNASGLASGVYFYSLTTAGHQQKKRMLLLK